MGGWPPTLHSSFLCGLGMLGSGGWEASVKPPHHWKSLTQTPRSIKKKWKRLPMPVWKGLWGFFWATGMDFGELNLYLLYILSHFRLTTALTDAASCSKSSSSAGEFEGDSWDRHLLALNKFFFALFSSGLSRNRFLLHLRRLPLSGLEVRLLCTHLGKINLEVKMPKGNQLFPFWTISSVDWVRKKNAPCKPSSQHCWEFSMPPSNQGLHQSWREASLSQVEDLIMRWKKKGSWSHQSLAQLQLNSLEIIQGNQWCREKVIHKMFKMHTLTKLAWGINWGQRMGP